MPSASSPSPDPGAEREEAASRKRALIVSDDLPVTMVTALVAGLVTTLLSAVRELTFIAMILAALVADVVKNYVERRTWDKRKLLGLTGLLTLLGTLGAFLARVLGRRAKDEPAAAAAAAEHTRSAWSIVATSAVSAGASICVFSGIILASGEPLFPDQQGEPPPSRVAGERACGNVDTHPNSDRGTFAIVANGLDCRTAREEAHLAPRDFTADGRAYEVAGFTCEGTLRRTGLTRVEFECARGAARVSFSAS